MDPLYEDPRDDPEGYDPDDPNLLKTDDSGFPLVTVIQGSKKKQVRIDIPEDVTCEICGQPGDDEKGPLVFIQDCHLQVRPCHQIACKRDLQTKIAEESFLFHGIWPFPEHCGMQMKLMGNANLHTLTYECPRCFTRLEVAATFHFYEPYKRGLSPEIRAAIDSTS